MAGDSPVAPEPPRLLSPDWSGDLDVQSAASSIVDHLMSKPLDISLAVEEEQQQMADPRVAMETRHRKVCINALTCILLIQHCYRINASGCVLVCIELCCTVVYYIIVHDII